VISRDNPGGFYDRCITSIEILQASKVFSGDVKIKKVIESAKPVAVSH